jgi:sialidase-1
MKPSLYYLLLAMLLQFPLLAFADLTTKFIFKNGEEGYSCYRIPAIIALPGGDLLAFAEARKKDCDDFGDVDLVMKKSSNKGKSWSPLSVVADFGLLKTGNPAPVVDRFDPRYPKGRLFLLYNTATTSEAEVKKGIGVREVWYITSTDGGKSWSIPVNITLSVHKPFAPAYNKSYRFSEDWRTNALTPGHALQLTSGRNKGRLFVAANHAKIDSGANGQATSKAHCFYSDDHGTTWHLGADINMAGGNESTAAELSGGGVLQNIRYQNRQVGRRILAFSGNGGENWDTAYISSELVDPVCEGSMVSVQYKHKHLLLFSNPSSQVKRERMTITVSADQGKTWPISFLVDGGPSAYSDMAVIGSKKVGLLYEKGSDGGIVYTLLSMKKVINN